MEVTATRAATQRLPPARPRVGVSVVTFHSSILSTAFSLSFFTHDGLEVIVFVDKIFCAQSTESVAYLTVVDFPYHQGLERECSFPPSLSFLPSLPSFPYLSFPPFEVAAAWASPVPHTAAAGPLQQLSA